MIKKVKLYFNSKEYETLYCCTNGAGGFNLTADLSVFFGKDEVSCYTSSFGWPDCENVEYDIMEFDGVLGVYDSNMELLQEYTDMEEVINNIEEIIDEFNVTYWEE